MAFSVIRIPCSFPRYSVLVIRVPCFLTVVLLRRRIADEFHRWLLPSDCGESRS